MSRLIRPVQQKKATFVVPGHCCRQPGFTPKDDPEKIFFSSPEKIRSLLSSSIIQA
jgi:hypothetical protein